jgi:hypothetical protein
MTELEKTMDKIRTNLSTTISKEIEQIYMLGQASIISLLFHFINNLNLDSEDIKQCFNKYIDGKNELKNMVYDCMKDRQN